MGGRGSSYSRSSDIAITAVGSDGKDIDLSGSPLHYGNKDPNLSGKVRKSIEEFENKRYNNKIEFSRFVDANGNVIEDNRGGKGSVRASFYAHQNAEAMSHNHPRSGMAVGALGGTFSDGDLNNFVKFNQSPYRATASEGTYSISKLKGFDSKGFKQYYTREYSKNRSAFKQTVSGLNKSYKSGGMSWDDYHANYVKSFNSYLVSLHNSLRSGQKLYGYHYTLERRSR